MSEEHNKVWYRNRAQVIKFVQGHTKINYGCNGRGIVSNYHLFDGISLFFLDFDTDDIMDYQKSNPDIISIVYCHKGRYECEFSNQQTFYVPAGSFAIMGTKDLPVSFSFPLKKCFAFSLVINRQNLSEETKKILEIFHLNVDKIIERLELDERNYLSRPVAGSELEQLFEEIYNARKRGEIEYFRIKALEFLYNISRLSKDDGCELEYCDKKYKKAVKEICHEMKENPDEKMSLKKLAKKYDINLSMFHKVFSQIYGETPYAYLKKYKMSLAADELKNSGRRINEIAVSLGYNNASKFTIAFKSVYGIGPKDYRKSQTIK